MQIDSQGKQMLFFKLLKTLTKGKQSKQIYMLSKDGRNMDNEENRMNIWKE